MTTVEDGEILEVENDGVIDLCSDEEPHPTPAFPPKSKSSRSRVRRNIAAFRANVYRGGDPYAYALNSQIDVDYTSVDEPHLSRTCLANKDVAGNASHLRKSSHRLTAHMVYKPPLPYLPNKEPSLHQGPYVPDNPMPPALHNGIGEPSRSHSHSFFDRIPPRVDVNASPLPTAALSGDAMWSYHAPHDGSGIQLGPHAEPHPDIPKSYDADRYSREGDQSRFPQAPIYHAEPGPPPSVRYRMHHQSMMPADASFRGLPFEMTQKQRLHPMNQMHDPPPSMYNHQSSSGVVRTEQGFFTRDNPDVIERYQSKTESVSGFRREREVPQNRNRQLHLKRENSFQDSYDRRFSFDAHYGSVSDTALDGKANRLDESDSRRIHVEPIKSSVCNEDARQANSVESGDSRERLGSTYGVPGSEDCDQGRSVRKGEQFHRSPPPLQDDASEGEISSPPFPSPVISLATAPDETPSPPSLKKKKPSGIDAKKRLLELRKRALMSVKKRPTPQNSHSSIQPISPRCSPPLATSESVEGSEELHGARRTHKRHDDGKDNDSDGQNWHVQSSKSSDEVMRGARIQTDSPMHVMVGGVRRTMTQVQFSHWQEWPYQNRIVVDYSSDSSNSTSGSDSEDDLLGYNPAVPKKSHRSPLYNREREIEAMKIRMVCLGKCPSMLTGRPEKLKPGSGSNVQQTQQRTEGRSQHMNNARTVTNVSNESTRSDIAQDKAGHATGDEQTVDPDDSFSLRQNCASKETEPRPDAIQPKSATDHLKKSAELTTVSCQTPVSVSSAENRVSPEQLNNQDLVSDSQSEKMKNEVVHDDKLSSNQTSPKEMNKKDSTVQVKSLRSPVAASNESPIAELKRRIAAIEKSRDMLKQQRHKKQRIAMDEETTASRTGNGLPRRRRSHRNSNLVMDRKKLPQVSKPGKSESPSSEVNNRERAQYQRSSRYYGPKSSSSLQSLSALKKGNAGDVAVDVPEVCCDVSDSSARTTVRGASDPTLEIPQDNAQRRYIDDLKLELEQKRKELMDERDRADQLRTAEVAIAEAQAKLDFTRSRVADLQEELRKAEFDVIDAEKEYQRRIKVAAQLRDANSGELTELKPEQECQGRVHYSLEISGNGAQDVIDDLAREEGNDIDKGQGEIDDYVLRPSPYSPSTGDYFTSCLRAFRAYLLRIPHHSKAKDRMAGSILSPTWGASLDPMKAICPQELRGQCSNKECDFQHLKIFKTPKDRALQVIEGIERFFSATDREKEAKLIINTRIAIHEGKDATAAISSLISELCASSKTVPYSCASE